MALGDRFGVMLVSLGWHCLILEGSSSPDDPGIVCSLCQHRALVCAVSSLHKQPIHTGLVFGSLDPCSHLLQTLALFIHDESSGIAGPLRNFGIIRLTLLSLVQDVSFVCTLWGIPSVITLNVCFLGR